jgi:cation:H+ antiporter
MMDTWIPLVGGLLLMIVGGELLVRGSVQVASRLGVSPLVIGLTLVGFGTSTPELVTSVQAALSGSPGIAYGNIVGSNIANILLILGAAALITPVLVASAALKRDSVVMIAVALAFAGVALVTPMTRLVGAVFVAALAAYIVVAFRQERTSTTGDHGAAYDKGFAAQSADTGLTPTAAGPHVVVSLLTALAGLALVIMGGKFLVDGAVGLAQSFGISETVIGLTIVAVGTSTPELVTSIIAAVRKQTDVAFGNIVGSNIYNILGIGGVTALIAPTPVPPEIVSTDNLIMVGASVLVVAMAYSGRRISRVEGGLLVAGYAAFLVWLVVA